MWLAADADGSGYIEYDEFAPMMASLLGAAEVPAEPEDDDDLLDALYDDVEVPYCRATRASPPEPESVCRTIPTTSGLTRRTFRRLQPPRGTPQAPRPLP